MFSQSCVPKHRRKAPDVKHPMQRRLKNATSALASELLSSLDCDTSALVRQLLLTNKGVELLDLKVDPSTFLDSQSFFSAYQAVSLLSKFPGLNTGYDLRHLALEKFKASEVLCRETNLRLSRESFKYACDYSPPRTPESIMVMARKKIERLLGPFNWDLAESHFAFGPGATTDLRRRHGDAYYKYREKPCSTPGNAVLAYTAIRRVPRWFDHVCSIAGLDPSAVVGMPIDVQIEKLLRLVDGNSVITVPKNAKTDRTIAIEPTMNGYVQHGIGGLIRKRLLRVGIDLNDQTQNQRFAKIASVDGDLATLDLSAASDSVSLELVRSLLPNDWVLAIEQARSPVGILPDGTKVRYQKVSSMGCGFTFELESLIFWAICSSVMSRFNSIDRRLCVYGDDLIVPVGIAHTVVWMLAYCGFSVNADKSFVSGPFRESCGKHYFRGDDVTPIYIRKDIDSPETLIWFCNQVRRLARMHWGLDGRFLSTYELGRSFLPSSLRKPSIPDGFGDAALFGDFDEVRPTRLSKRHEGYFGLVHVRVARTFKADDVPYALRVLANLSADRPSFEERLVRWLRSDVKRRELGVPFSDGIPVAGKWFWRSVKIPVVQWESFGPWLVR